MIVESNCDINCDCPGGRYSCYRGDPGDCCASCIKVIGIGCGILGGALGGALVGAVSGAIIFCALALQVTFFVAIGCLIASAVGKQLHYNPLIAVALIALKILVISGGAFGLAIGGFLGFGYCLRVLS